MEDKCETNAGRQEQEILQILEAKGRLLGRELFETIGRRSNTNKETFLDAIETLRAARMIQLNPLPRSFSNFVAYLSAYELSWPFWLVVALAFAVVSAVALGSEVFPWGLVRLLAGAAFLVFVPGFSLERALFGTNAKRDSFERFALSIGLSLSIVPIAAIFVSYTPLGLNVLAMTRILTSFSIAAITAACYRDYLSWKKHFEAVSHTR